MAVINDMRSYILQKRKAKETLSGHQKDDWIDVCDINVAVYLIDEMSVTGNVRYDQYNCAGITFYTEFDKTKKYRIVADNETFDIKRAVRNGCTTHLLLKGNLI